MLLYRDSSFQSTSILHQQKDTIRLLSKRAFSTGLFIRRARALHFINGPRKIHPNMGSQQPIDVEVIDLTNENELNGTITLDDTVIPAHSPSHGADSSSVHSILSSSPSRLDSPILPSPPAYSPVRTPDLPVPSPASLVSSSSDVRHEELVEDDEEAGEQVEDEDIVEEQTVRKAVGKSQQSRDERKKRKDEEVLQKQANKANAACHALENCTTNIDEAILKLIDDPEQLILRTLFDESMIKYQLTTFPKLGSSISWTYKRMEIVDDECVPQYKESPWLIVVMTGKDYLDKVLSYRSDPNGENSLKVFLEQTRRRSKCYVILFVYNLANHLKSERLKEAKNYRKKFDERFGQVSNNNLTEHNDNTSSVPSIGITELQELRLMLELELKHDNPDLKLHIEFYEKTNEICQAIVRYTLSIARLDAKQKLKSSTGLDWAINMDKERAVDPTKSDQDLTKLWITQLQQFSQVTLPIAKAIASEYPYPCALIDQYRSLTTSEAEDLLAEISVQKNLRRQIGSNISKRIHCFLTCQDPDVHIGLG